MRVAKRLRTFWATRSWNTLNFSWTGWSVQLVAKGCQSKKTQMFLSCKEKLPEHIDIIYINIISKLPNIQVQTCVNEPLVCLLTVGRKNTILYTVQAFVQTDEPVTYSSQAEGRANTTVH